MGIDDFNPKIAILTNLYDAHLDYHGTKQEYIAAKANITKNQTELEYLIVNADQEETLEVARPLKGSALFLFRQRRNLLKVHIFLMAGLCFKREKVMEIENIAFREPQS